MQRPARPSPSPCRNTLMPRPHHPAHSALSRTQTACDTLADMQAVTTSIGSVVNHTVTVICDAALCASSTFLLCTASHLCSFEWQSAQMCHPLGRPLGRRCCWQMRQYPLRACCTTGGTRSAHGASVALACLAFYRPQCGRPAAVRSHHGRCCEPPGRPLMAILAAADTQSFSCVSWCAGASTRRDRVRWHVCCDMAQIGVRVSVRYLGSTVELETHLGLSGHRTLMYLNVV